MNLHTILSTRHIVAALVLLLAIPAVAVTDGKKDKKPTEKKKEEGIKVLRDVTKKCVRHDGLFTLYQDTTNGSVYLLVKKSQLDKDHLYFSQVADGVVDAGYFRGSYGDSRIFRIGRYFDRLEVRLQNTEYYFDPASPLARAEKANINEPVLVSEKIEAANKSQDSLLIKADALFTGEGFQQIKYPAPPGFPSEYWFDLGSLDKDKSKVLGIRNYPKNTDVVSEYVWSNPYPKNYGSSAVTDARSVSIRFHHSLIELPDNDFRPRFDDPRIGYFTTQVEDMTTTDAVNYRDLIHRWHLVKKDPAAAISEPVEPITWWIENTTPVEFRKTIREGVEAWNIAFEKAGFRNAVVVKEQPDTATWDAGDIRYNVLRWTSSPEPPFGGYGPSFVDPRTGQILGADVMLEFIFITNRLREQELFQTAGMGYMAMSEAELELSRDRCSFANDLHLNMLFGSEALSAMDLDAVEKERFVQEALRDLVLHEVGHTLGLNHNMKASSIHTVEELRDRALTERTGLTGSVMDYSPANLPWEDGDVVQYFHSTPGPYDVWAVRYGYSAQANAEVENIALAAILAESKDSLLIFGNDADDMRSPGHGIDPRVNIFDMSADPVEHGIRTIVIADRTLTHRASALRHRRPQLPGTAEQLLRPYRAHVQCLQRDDPADRWHLRGPVLRCTEQPCEALHTRALGHAEKGHGRLGEVCLRPGCLPCRYRPVPVLTGAAPWLLALEHERRPEVARPYVERADQNACAPAAPQHAPPLGGCIRVRQCLHPTGDDDGPDRRHLRSGPCRCREHLPPEPAAGLCGSTDHSDRRQERTPRTCPEHGPVRTGPHTQRTGDERERQRHTGPPHGPEAEDRSRAGYGEVGSYPRTIMSGGSLGKHTIAPTPPDPLRSNLFLCRTPTFRTRRNTIFAAP